MSKLAFPGDCNPNFPWEKSHWDNTVVKKNKPKKNLQHPTDVPVKPQAANLNFLWYMHARLKIPGLLLVSYTRGRTARYMSKTESKFGWFLMYLSQTEYLIIDECS